MEISYKESHSENSKLSLKKCEICFKIKSQYTCPKCNIGYCSLNCYRDQTKHLNCSENFYQDQVLNELKSFKLNSAEDKNKIAEILTREKEEMENDEYAALHSSNNNLKDVESKIENVEKIDDHDLSKAYENVVMMWAPWWLSESLKKSKLIEVNDTELDHDSYSYFNKILVRNSQQVNVSNANHLIYNEMLKLAYLYCLIGYVYQLNDGKTIETSLNDEIIFSILQVNKHLSSELANSDLKTSLNLAIKFLATSSEENFFLKNNVNLNFLINLLNDLIFLIKSPNILLYVFSNLYDIFQNSVSRSTRSKSEKENDSSAEKPINFFHHNKPTVEKKDSIHITDKKPRIEIISKKTFPKVSNAASKTFQVQKDTSVSTKEVKLYLRKIEYFFKWLNVSQNISNCISNSEFLASDLESLKETLNQQCIEFDKKKEFIDKNLSYIRKNQTIQSNQKLIEEI